MTDDKRWNVSNLRRLRRQLWLRRATAAAVVMVLAVATWLTPRPYQRPQDTAAAQATSGKIASRLARVDLQKVPLKDAFAWIERAGGVRVVYDRAALAACGVSVDMPITVQLADVTVWAAMMQVVREALTGSPLRSQHSLQVEPNGVIALLTPAQRRARTFWRAYDIRPLLVEAQAPPERSKKFEQELVSVMTEAIAPESWETQGGVVGAIHVKDGRLHVRHTAEEHDQIGWILYQFEDDIRRHELERLAARLRGSRAKGGG